MTPIVRCLAALALCLGLAACALDPGTEPPRGAPLVLEPAMQQAALSLLKDYRPPTASISTVHVHETYNRGVNVTHQQIRSSHTRQESGVWAEVTSVGVQGRPGGTVRTVHACGLMALVTAVTTGSVGIQGTSFVPFGIHAPFGQGLWTRAAAMEIAADAVCAPSAGFTFTARMEYESWSKPIYSTVGTIRNRSSGELTCTAAAQAKPAREFGVPMNGEGLQLSCEFSPASGPKVPSEYVFVRELGFYLLLSRGRPGDLRVLTVRYETVEGGP
jgi:hypothetical protein